MTMKKLKEFVKVKLLPLLMLQDQLCTFKIWKHNLLKKLNQKITNKKIRKVLI